MQPFEVQIAATFKISASNDWLLHQQGLALPALSPTTPEAWQYFFVKIHEGMNYKALLRTGTSLLMVKIASMLSLKFFHPLLRPGKRLQILYLTRNDSGQN
jgi:hypothetical protein